MDGQTQRMTYYLPEKGNPNPDDCSHVLQPVSGLSADAVRKVVTKLRRLPNMADRQGADSPSVWMKLGECIADLEMLLDGGIDG